MNRNLMRNAETEAATSEWATVRTIEAREQGRYIEVAFLVPEGTEHIEVHYQVLPVSDKEGQEEATSIIDLGVRDIRRMRGWSGGARSEFSLGLHEATPGYKAGSIQAGEWAVVLGAHRIAAGGCQVKLKIRCRIARPRWLCGDLHLHTVHSDGSYTVEETIEAARSAGLDYIALTDHNTSSQNAWAGLSEDLLLLPGMELTTGSGHCNLYGAEDPLPDFRASSPAQLHTRLTEARAAGALISINHPHCSNCPWLWGFDADYDWVEIWNGPWREANRLTLDWWQEQLAGGRRITAVGGSDTHRPDPYVRHGHPTAWVFADLFDTESILRAIGQGKVSLSAEPDGAFAELFCGAAVTGEIVRIESESPAPMMRLQAIRLRIGDEIRLWSDAGHEHSAAAAKDGEFTWEWPVGARRFWRVEIWRSCPERGKWQLAAVTNPIYFDSDKGDTDRTDEER